MARIIKTVRGFEADRKIMKIVLVHAPIMGMAIITITEIRIITAPNLVFRICQEPDLKVISKVKKNENTNK
jgi:hypothetical protein